MQTLRAEAGEEIDKEPLAFSAVSWHGRARAAAARSRAPVVLVQETYESLVDTSGLAETFAVRQRTLQEYVRPVVEWVPPEQH